MQNAVYAVVLFVRDLGQAAIRQREFYGRGGGDPWIAWTSCAVRQCTDHFQLRNKKSFTLHCMEYSAKQFFHCVIKLASSQLKIGREYVSDHVMIWHVRGLKWSGITIILFQNHYKLRNLTHPGFKSNLSNEACLLVCLLVSLLYFHFHNIHNTTSST